MIPMLCHQLMMTTHNIASRQSQEQFKIVASIDGRIGAEIPRLSKLMAVEHGGDDMRNAGVLESGSIEVPRNTGMGHDPFLLAKFPKEAVHRRRLGSALECIEAGPNMLGKKAIVSVQKHDVRSCRFLYSPVARDRHEPLIGLTDVPHSRKSTHNVIGMIRGAVVHHENLADR